MGECKHDGEEACGSVLTHRDRKGLCLLFHYCPLIYLRQRLSLNQGCRFAQLAWRPESSFRSPFSALLGIEATGRCEREAWFVVSGCCDANFDRSHGFVSECFLLQLYQPPSAIPRVSTWQVVGILQIMYEIVSPHFFRFYLFSVSFTTSVLIPSICSSLHIHPLALPTLQIIQNLRGKKDKQTNKQINAK